MVVVVTAVMVMVMAVAVFLAVAVLLAVVLVPVEAPAVVARARSDRFAHGTNNAPEKCVYAYQRKRSMRTCKAAAITNQPGKPNSGPG